MARVAIIGCGLSGEAWTIGFLRGGHDVVLWDDKPAAMTNLRGSLAETFDDLRDHGLLAERQSWRDRRLMALVEHKKKANKGNRA